MNAPVPPALLAAGLQLYKYRLISKIGEGGFGEVWLAKDIALNRDFAVKILKPGLTVDARLREAQIGNQLTHNNLVHVHMADVVQLGGADAVILAMEYLPAGSVEGLANPAGYLPLPEVLRIGRDILQGLDYLHARNFFHNDIKPGNILTGPQGQAMLSDYGIAGVSPDGQPVAAPNAYLLHRAPEVRATGNIGVGSDVFQTGLTLARLLIGLSHFQSIWSATGKAEYEKLVDKGKLLGPKDFPSHIPAPVRRVIQKAVDPNPAKRWSSALDMRRALEKLDFPGFWTVDAAGNEVGQDTAYSYTYEIKPVSGGKADVTCRRTNLVSGNTQRITRHCGKGLTSKEAEKLADAFKLAVVTGK